MADVARLITFCGRVQGVGFRFTAQRIACRYGIRGYVRNLPDGNVEMLAQESKENVAEMIKNAGKWAVSNCSCRQPHWIADPGNHCEHLLETCLFMGDMAKWGLAHNMCREITYEEAVEILHKSNENGLVHTHDPEEFICNCCHDCCVFFVGINSTGANILEPSEFVAKIDEEDCTACNLCADRCPVDAIEVDDFAVIDEDKCLGCGVCFPTCPTESVSLVRRPVVEQA